MATGLAAWSQTAANNANSDENINWAEGQFPSSVNDSARAMMAAMAKWRDDNSGALTTTGSSTAYSVTTNQGFSTLSALNGQTLRLIFNTANGANATLNVDGLGAKSLVTDAGTAIPSGWIKSGAVLDVVYDNVNSCFVVVGAGLQEFASGTKMVFRQSSAPAGWTKETENDDAALRVTSGTPGTGGTADFSEVFTSRTIAKENLPNYELSNTLDVGGSISILSGVSPAIAPKQGQPGFGVAQGTGPTGIFAASAFVALSADISNLSVTGSVTSGGSGTAMDFAVKYVDVIVAEKD